MSFSGSFEIVGSKLIGRKDEMSTGFSPGLGIIIMRAFFNGLGQYSSRSMMLNICIRFTSPSFGSSCSILAVIRSRPGAFFLFNILISSLTSFKVNALRRPCDWMCVARSCSTFWSWSLLCGEKTSKRCSANSSAFSLSLFAHGPGGVEYLRMGVMLFRVFSYFL